MGDLIKDKPVERNNQDIGSLADSLLKANQAKTLRDAVAEQAQRMDVKLPPGFLPSDSQLENMVGTLRQGLRLPSETSAEFEVKSQVSRDHLPVHSEHGDAPAQKTQGSALKWLQLPEKGAARDMLQSMASQANPNATAAQDGLKLFSKGLTAPSNFAAETMTSSAALMLPKAQVQNLLATCSQSMASPETTKALSLLQWATPALTQGAEPELLEPLMQKWLSANSASKADVMNLLGALVNILQQDGLASMPEAQHLLGRFIEESGLGEILADDAQAVKNLSDQLQGANASGLPMMSGLREFFGSHPMQGLSQILQPLMRLLTGLFLTKPQNQFPNCLPDERTMSELAALFANRSRKPETKTPRKRRKRKGFAFFLDGIEGDQDACFGEAETYEIRERIPAMA